MFGQWERSQQPEMLHGGMVHSSNAVRLLARNSMCAPPAAPPRKGAKRKPKAEPKCRLPAWSLSSCLPRWSLRMQVGAEIPCKEHGGWLYPRNKAYPKKACLWKDESHQDRC